MSNVMPPATAILRLRQAKNQLLLSQIATLDLARLSDTEATRLDFPENRARRLAETLGHPDIPLQKAVALYNAAEEFTQQAAKRKKDRASASSGEPPADSAERDNSFGEGVESSRKKDAENSEDTEVDAESLDVFSRFGEALGDAGLPRRATMNVLISCMKIGSEKSRSGLMLESLLISAVAQFEVFISRVITTSLRFDSTILDGSERKYTFAEIRAYGSLEDFTKASAATYVDSLMHDGIDSWMKFLARATRTDTTWVNDLLSEVVMRRNVHVHAGGRASAQYLKVLGKNAAAVKVGDDLPVTEDYLEDALNRMARASIVLSQAGVMAVCSSQRGKAEKRALEPDLGVLESVFDLLVAGRWSAVAPISDQLHSLVSTASTRERLRANSFHAQKEWHGEESVRPDIEAWDVSASDDELRLAKHCLLGELDQAKLLYAHLARAGKLSVMELAMWPILEPIRSELGQIDLDES